MQTLNEEERPYDYRRNLHSEIVMRAEPLPKDLAWSYCGLHRRLLLPIRAETKEVDFGWFVELGLASRNHPAVFL